MVENDKLPSGATLPSALPPAARSQKIEATPVASKGPRVTSPALDLAMLALPTRSVAAIVQRAPPGDMSRCNERGDLDSVCGALAAAVTQECGRCAALSTARRVVQTRVVLFLVGSPGSPADPLHPHDPRQEGADSDTKMADVSESEDEVGSAGGAADPGTEVSHAMNAAKMDDIQFVRRRNRRQTKGKARSEQKRQTGSSDAVTETVKALESHAYLLVHALRFPASDASAWSAQLSRPAVVLVAYATDALDAFLAGSLCLDRVHLLVYDAADRARDPRDPVASLLRDALPSIAATRRPRVLGLLRAMLQHPADIAAIEASLGVRFFGGSGSNSRVFAGSHRVQLRPVAAASPAKPLVDMQTLYYPRSGAEGPVAPGEHAKIAAEVGPLGVALYQRRVRLRHLRRKWRRILRNSATCGGTGEVRRTESTEFLEDSGVRTYDPLDELGGRDLLLGLVPKALTLLDFLQTECAILSSADACLVQGGVAAVVDGEDSNYAKLSFPAGSTSPLSRSIIVNAGSPTVAAALHEVVRHLPGFAEVKSSVVIGDAHAAQSFDQSRVVSSQVSDGWQGAESDDDAINAFQIGEVNILFVASENAAKIARDRRPLPLAGLVIYYDGKTRNLLDDAATIARRRIVTFFSANEKRHVALPPLAGAKANGAAKGAGGVSATPRQGCLAIQSPHGPKSVATGTTAGAGSVDTPEIAGTSEGPKYDDVLGEKNEFNFKIRPPAALRGPSDAGGDVCYLYSISPVVPSDGTDGTVMKDATDVSSFAIVLTAELAEDDLVMSPVNDGAAVVEHSNCAALVLTHLGNTILSAEQVEAGRKYTAFLLSAVSKRHDPRAFQWGKIAMENGDQTRRYLVLPLQSQSAVRNAKQCSIVAYDEDLLYREDCVQKYFGRDFIESSAKDSANCSGHVLVDNSAMPTVSDAVAAGRTTVDWAAVYGIVSSQEAAQAASRQDSVSVPESVPCPRRHSVDLYAHFEGSLVFAQYDAKMKPYVTAHLDWCTSPLMSFVRQKRFDLDANGNLVEWKRAQKELVAGYVDLASLVPRNIVATEDQRSSSDVAQAAKLEADEMQSSRKRGRESASSLTQKEPIRSKNDLNRPLKKQCIGLPGDDVPSSSELLPSAAIEKISLPVVANNGGFRMQVFDAERNTRKRRKAWYGPVISSFERHLLETRSLTCKRLHQPLLSAVTPDCLPLAAFWRVAKGTPMSTITEEYLKSEVEINCDAGQMLVPEFTAEYAIPAGSLFLPSVLLLMERHLTTCAFRTLFAESLDCVIDIPRLNCALTSSSVSSSENYERLELLGDSVLKLGSTIRLFVKHPHYAEGDLHPIRCSIVSNNALSKKALEAGIKHYLNFTSSLLSDWNPPGYDMDAQPLPLHDKALADVLEAVTGAYYLQGASEYTAAHGNGEQQAAPTDGGEAAMSPSSSSPSLANGIVRGYVYGTRFLEAIGVLDTKEPSQEELLKAAIHAMHNPSAPPPTDTKPSSFPADRRMTHPSKPWENHLGRVEFELGYKFKRRQLLFCALTHGSFADSMHAGKPLLSKYETFQRLEFLGDAALDFCVARYLFDRYPNQGPGDLTELKSAVVSNEAFARISVERKFYAYLYTNSKAMRNEVDKFVRACEAENADKDAGDSNEWWSREREAPKVLGDIFEAIIGAILVDAGLATVWNVCMRLLGPTLRERADPATFATHPVKLFQDFVTKEQRLSTAPPLYFIPEKGVMGSRLIRATVSVHKKPIATGEGSTKKRAMCMAAQKALARLAAAQRPQSADAGLLQKLRFLGEKERAVQAQLRRRF